MSPVYVANHYRAIADLAMLELKDGEYPQIATVDSINQWLDTDEQFNTLVQGYLIPLTSQLDENALTQYEQWLKTIKFQ